MMRKLSSYAMMALLMVAVSACGKKNKNGGQPGDAPQGPPPPTSSAPPPTHNPNPNQPYGNFDFERQPAKVEFYRGTAHCYNFRDEAVGCQDVVNLLRQQGVFPDPRIPYMEFWVDGMQPNGWYNGPYAYQHGQGNWGGFGYPQHGNAYPQYPYGTYDPNGGGYYPGNYNYFY